MGTTATFNETNQKLAKTHNPTILRKQILFGDKATFMVKLNPLVAHKFTHLTIRSILI